MKKKILYGLLALVLIVDIIITATAGLRVSLYYGEGYSIKVSEKDTINKEDVEKIVKEVFEKDYVVQDLELFKDSVVIKVKEVSDEKVQVLVDKLNEKYSSSLTKDDVKVEHVSNVKIRSLVEPYVIPTLIATALVLVFYAIRYRGAKQMLELIKYLLLAEGVLYTLHAIVRVPVNTMTLPVAFSLYALVILVYTFIGEWNKVK